MAENAPPTNTASNADSTRGMPYYDKLRRDLRETLQKKRLLDKSMATLEDSIYRFEASYLEETTAGNIIKGFDNYIKGSSGTITSTLSSSTGGGGGGGGTGTAGRRKGVVMEQDRVFSNSSATFMRVCFFPIRQIILFPCFAVEVVWVLGKGNYEEEALIMRAEAVRFSNPLILTNDPLARTNSDIVLRASAVGEG
ncbi:MAG: hypothetical protein M1830_009042, partial [Pleopsidium flavum]